MTEQLEGFLQTLYWCLFSPDLHNSTELPTLDSNFFERGWQALRKVPISSRNLPEFSGRIGNYFEEFIEFFLKEHPWVSSLRRGLQIHLEKQTIGEADFLFFNEHSKRWVHLEVAVKYYLYSSENQDSICQASNFLGPNAVDTLGKKLKKLSDHQMTLIQKNLHLIPELQESSSLESRLLFKGFLFYPLGDQPKGIRTVSNQISKNHNRGWWIRPSELMADHLPWKSYQFLERRHWLGNSYWDRLEGQTFDRKEFMKFSHDRFRSLSSPLMFDCYSDKPGDSESRSRLIVVSENWPNTGR